MIFLSLFIRWIWFLGEACSFLLHTYCFAVSLVFIIGLWLLFRNCHVFLGFLPSHFLMQRISASLLPIPITTKTLFSSVAVVPAVFWQYQLPSSTIFLADHRCLTLLLLPSASVLLFSVNYCDLSSCWPCSCVVRIYSLARFLSSWSRAMVTLETHSYFLWTILLKRNILLFSPSFYYVVVEIIVKETWYHALFLLAVLCNSSCLPSLQGHLSAQIVSLCLVWTVSLSHFQSGFLPECWSHDILFSLLPWYSLNMLILAVTPLKYVSIRLLIKLMIFLFITSVYGGFCNFPSSSFIWWSKRQAIVYFSPLVPNVLVRLILLLG